jgi:hypothetical protein
MALEKSKIKGMVGQLGLPILTGFDFMHFFFSSIGSVDFFLCISFYCWDLI